MCIYICVGTCMCLCVPVIVCVCEGGCVSLGVGDVSMLVCVVGCVCRVVSLLCV